MFSFKYILKELGFESSRYWTVDWGAEDLWQPRSLPFLFGPFGAQQRAWNALGDHKHLREFLAPESRGQSRISVG